MGAALIYPRAMTRDEIRYVVGDAAAPSGDDTKIIVHVCNDTGGWGAGFVLALSDRWKAPERSYRAWHKGGEPAGFRLGAVQFVAVEPSVLVANLIGQHGIKRSPKGIAPVRYEAIREGLDAVAERALAERASVHMPRIGCGLAGGSWDVVGPMINEALCAKGVAVIVYDLK